MNKTAFGYLLIIIVIYLFGVGLLFALKRYLKDMKVITEKYKNKKKEVVEKKKEEVKLPTWVNIIIWIVVSYGILYWIYEKINGYEAVEWWGPLTVPFIPFLLLFGYISEHQKEISYAIAAIFVVWFGTNVITLLRQISSQLEELKNEFRNRN